MSYASDGYYYAPPAAYPGPYGVTINNAGPTLQPVTDPYAPRQDKVPQRRRPKYTRSKNGCLTCRNKKVKCDEAQPVCGRCSGAQRECIWPPRVHRRRSDSTVDEEVSTSVMASASPGSPESAPSSSSSDEARRNQMNETRVPPTNFAGFSTYEGGDTSVVPRSNYPVHERFDNYNMPSSTTSAAVLQPKPMPACAQPSPFPNPTPYNGHISSSVKPSNHTHGDSQDADSAQLFNLAWSPASSRPPSSQSSSSGHSMSLTTPNNQTRNPMYSMINDMAPYYNSTREASLMQHYTTYASQIIMSIPDLDPISSSHLELALSQPVGADLVVDALRTSLLGVAAMHQAFLLTRAGAVPNGEEQRQLANFFRRDAKKKLANACLQSNELMTRSDAALMAVQAIAMIDIFAGVSGGHWSRNLGLGKALVKLRGGPAALIRATPLPSRSQIRMFLELLTVYDVLGGWATGQKPEMLSAEMNDWWRLHAVSPFERIFGFSRDVVVFMAEVVSLLARPVPTNPRFVEIDGATLDQSEAIVAEGKALLQRLDQWVPQQDGQHNRVAAGNEVYRRTLQIAILQGILDFRNMHPLVQQYADVVISLCTDAVRAGMGVILLWPVLIAGSVTPKAKRHLVTALLSGFRSQCCFEVDMVEDVIIKVWRRVDSQEPRADWRSVAQDYNLNFLVV